MVRGRKTTRPVSFFFLGGDGESIDARAEREEEKKVSSPNSLGCNLFPSLAKRTSRNRTDQTRHQERERAEKAPPWGHATARKKSETCSSATGR